MRELPILFVRPTILCIDDDESISDSILNLLNKFYSIKIFNNSEGLFKYLKNYQSFFERNEFITGFTESEYNDNPHLSIIKLDINNIFTAIDNQNIQQDIGVVLVDYLMPDLDGISLCNMLNKFYFKKILVTGSKEYKIGIKAIRDNIIDGYIGKEELSNALLTTIEEMVFEYYNDRTASLKKALEVDSKLPISDKLFANYFLTILRKGDIVRYSIFDKNGSIVMVNSSGKQSILIVHTESSLQQFLQLIHEEPEFSTMYYLISTKQMIPFVSNCNTTNNLNLELIKLYKPELLIGEKKYYIFHLEE